jgi:hypothetical protein
VPRGVRIASVVAVAASSLAFAQAASAATLVGDYQLQGSLASSGPGPALTDIGAGNAFQSDTVMGVQRQILAFPQGNGLRMAPAGLPAPGPEAQYSEVLTFRFASVTPDYFRILDSLAGSGAEDSGLYVRDAKLDFYSQSGALDFESTAGLFAPDTYATVAMVAFGFPVGVKAYFNGAPVAQFPGDYNPASDTLDFFYDNEGGEESAGAVSCIRVFSGALTDAEVAAIGADSRCGAPAPPPPSAVVTPHKKKCKKRKKKHRAAEAKKKKCKKRRSAELDRE